MVSVRAATLAALTLPSRHPAVETQPEVTLLNPVAEVEMTAETAVETAVIRLSPAVPFPPSSLDPATVSAVVTVPSLPLLPVLASVAVTTTPLTSPRLLFRLQEPVAVAAAETSPGVLSQPSSLAPAKASVVAMARTEASRSELDPLSKWIFVE
jgi:ABC-type transport system involved in cytochrome c biogenesis permease subunit